MLQEENGPKEGKMMDWAFVRLARACLTAMDLVENAGSGFCSVRRVLLA